eukprot:PhM_4_TR18499/c0_g1_i1/m.71869
MVLRDLIIAFRANRHNIDLPLDVFARVFPVNLVNGSELTRTPQGKLWFQACITPENAATIAQWLRSVAHDDSNTTVETLSVVQAVVKQGSDQIGEAVWDVLIELSSSVVERVRTTAQRLLRSSPVEVHLRLARDFISLEASDHLLACLPFAEECHKRVLDAMLVALLSSGTSQAKQRTLLSYFTAREDAGTAPVSSWEVVRVRLLQVVDMWRRDDYMTDQQRVIFEDTLLLLLRLLPAVSWNEHTDTRTMMSSILEYGLISELNNDGNNKIQKTFEALLPLIYDRNTNVRHATTQLFWERYPGRREYKACGILLGASVTQCLLGEFVRSELFRILLAMQQSSDDTDNDDDIESVSDGALDDVAHNQVIRLLQACPNDAWAIPPELLDVVVELAFPLPPPPRPTDGDLTLSMSTPNLSNNTADSMAPPLTYTVGQRYSEIRVLARDALRRTVNCSSVYYALHTLLLRYPTLGKARRQILSFNFNDIIRAMPIDMKFAGVSLCELLLDYATMDMDDETRTLCQQLLRAGRQNTALITSLAKMTSVQLSSDICLRVLKASPILHACPTTFSLLGNLLPWLAHYDPEVREEMRRFLRRNCSELDGVQRWLRDTLRATWCQEDGKITVIQHLIDAIPPSHIDAETAEVVLGILHAPELVNINMDSDEEGGVIPMRRALRELCAHFLSMQTNHAELIRGTCYRNNKSHQNSAGDADSTVVLSKVVSRAEAVTAFTSALNGSARARALLRRSHNEPELIAYLEGVIASALAGGATRSELVEAVHCLPSIEGLGKAVFAFVYRCAVGTDEPISGEEEAAAARHPAVMYPDVKKAAKGLFVRS